MEDFVRYAAVPGAILLFWGLSGPASSLFGRISSAVRKAWAKSPAKEGSKSRPQPLDAAEHFYLLREHYRETGQVARVKVMDDQLAAGVFAWGDEWVGLRIAETPE